MMEMAVVETWIKTDLKKTVKVHSIGGNLFSQDNMGNLIGVEILSDGQVAEVTGTVSANALRADGATVAVTGTLTGNKASVTLPQAAYAIPGMLSVVIKLTSGSTVTTIGAIQAIVYRSSTDSAVDPGTIIPSVQDLIARIDAAVASIPPDYSALSNQVNTNTDDVSSLKSAIDAVAYVGGGDVSASATAYFQFEIEAGKTYRITNNTNGVISCTTRETQSGANIDDIGNIFAGTSLDWTAENNAYYLRAYSGGTGEVTIEALDRRMPEAEAAIKAISNTIEIQGTSGSTKYTTMNLKAGEWIVVTNGTSGIINLRTRNDQSGVNIETIGDLGAGQTLIYQIKTDAILLGFYCSVSGTVTVKRGVIANMAEIEDRVSEISEEVDIDGTASTIVYKQFNLKAGNIIIITNNTTAVVNGRTRNTESGANIDTIGNIDAGATVTYTITANAALLGFYFSATGSVTVKRGTLEELIENTGKRFTIGSGERFTTLREGIAEAIKYPYSYVFVKDGVYNLAEEFATEISNSTASKYGIKLGNNVHVVFSSGATVTAIYDGTDQNVTRYFNPFYTDDSGYTIENLNITAKNTRYCIHDENGGGNNHRTVKIINCQFDFDNTSAPINYYPQCIGGGNGAHDYIEIRDCYFKSKVAESTPIQIVSYHQDGTSATAQSNVFLSNCYFADKGTFRVTYYGKTTKVSKAYVSGCSFGSAPYVGQEVSSNPAPENYELIEWGNIVRA